VQQVFCEGCPASIPLAILSGMGCPARMQEIPGRVLAALLDLRERLGACFGERLTDLRLFGSYSRGDWGPESDVDVLVVIAELNEQERRKLFYLAEDVYFDHEVPLSPLALSSAEWSLLRARQYLIADDIEREGIVL